MPTFPRATFSSSEVLAATVTGLCWKSALNSQKQSLLTKDKHDPVFILWRWSYVSVSIFNVSFHRIKAWFFSMLSGVLTIQKFLSAIDFSQVNILYQVLYWEENI